MRPRIDCQIMHLLFEVLHLTLTNIFAQLTGGNYETKKG